MARSARAEMIAAIAQALGPRQLVWSGLRGDDVEPLTDLPQLDASFSMIGRYSRRQSIDGLAHEDLTGVRPDLELYDIDDHLYEESAREFRRAHLRALSGPSALLPYRPSPFLSSIWFARRDRCLNLGLFAGHGSAFDYKPWVETSLQEIGIETLPWTYVADEEQLAARPLTIEGPVVLRRSRTSGGEGFAIADGIAEVARSWPTVDDQFVSVAPLLSSGLPLNVGATVWADGEVTVDLPSVQLIGIPECVRRPFGYCGNDFVLAQSLDRELVDEIERTTHRIGRWLSEHGYLGSYGVDYLHHEGRLLFVEVNPRFQGSTPAACRVAIEAEEPCLMLEHIAAHLRLPRPARRPLWERLQSSECLAQVVAHWTGDDAAVAKTIHHGDSRSRAPSWLSRDVDSFAGLVLEPGAVRFRISLRSSVTSSGNELEGPILNLIQSSMDTGEL